MGVLTTPTPVAGRHCTGTLRAELTIEAESKGIVTDEDVFDRVS